MKPAAILLLASAALAEAERVPVRLEERTTATTLPLVTFPQANLELSTRRPSGLESVPELSPNARYAVARLGSRRIPLAFDVPAGATALGLLHTGAGEPALGHARAGGVRGILVDFADVAAGDLRLDVRLQYRGTELRNAGVQLARHRRGRAPIGGAMREVVLVDADADGRYDGGDDRWVALRADRVTKIRNLRKAEALLLREPQIPFEDDGRALMVEDVAADGSSLVLVLDEPETRMEEVLERRYAEVRAEHFRRFKREREAFLAKHDVDASRPRTFKPAKWLRVPLSEGKAIAKRQGKPLLVFYVTESNPWCFRYDYYTFRDKEVDGLLRKVIRIRIDAEKDPERSHAKAGARGIPALVPMTAGGEPVTFKVRLRKPSGEVTDLDRAEKMITGWQRPRDLAVNLQRILEAAR